MMGILQRGRLSRNLFIMYGIARESNIDAPTDQYPFILRDAAEAFLNEGLEAGRLALVPIAREIWPGLPRGEKRVRTSTPREPSVGQRTFSPKRSAATFLRDGFRCRYCAGEIIPKPIALLMHSLYSAELPFHPNYKAGYIHPLFWTRVAEADHLVAGSSGGAWTDPANHVTACVLCNTKKRALSLQDLGWTLRTPAPGWDGLVSLYPRLWKRAGQPRPEFHAPWLEVFAAVGR
jgi:5-methylcytosine-specific restriction endonuclease McrA